MATLRLIPKDELAKNELGGQYLAERWYNSKSGNPETITGKCKVSPVVIRFAVGGSLSAPVWSDEYELTATGSPIDADDLGAAINASITYQGYNIVLVKCVANQESAEDFYAVINGSNENLHPPVYV